MTLQITKDRALNPSNILKALFFITVELISPSGKKSFVDKLDIHKIK